MKHCCIIIDKNLASPIYSAYGYTHHNSTAAGNTSNLFTVIGEENRMHGNPPAIICTDVNADTDDITYVRDPLLATENWIGVGARASVWGGTDNASTCHATNSRLEGTRMHFVFIHPALARHIVKVHTHDDGTYATRGRIEVAFRFNGNTFVTRTAGKINPLHDQNPVPGSTTTAEWRAKVRTSIEGELHGNEDQLQNNQQQKDVDSVVACWVNIMEEGIIKATGMETHGNTLPRGRGSASIRWTMQQPTPQTRAIIATCMCE